MTARAFMVVPLMLLSCGTDRTGGVDPDEPPLLYPKTSKAPLYDERVVVDFHLVFEGTEWEEFHDCWKNKVHCDDASGAKVYVHCSLSFAGTTYKEAACRPKGNPGDWANEKKPQFIVRFDKWHDDGRFFGTRRIDLEANATHAAPVRDRIGMWVMRHAGLQASRANHARLFVNGGLMGLYQNIEVVDHEFLEERFDYPIGNMYENDKGDWSKLTNKSAGDYSDITALEDIVVKEPKTGDHSGFFADLPKLMDVDQVLREMAAEAVFPTWDGYSNGSWNFFYYNCPGRGFMVIPWDLDDVLSDLVKPEEDPWTFTGHAGELHRIRVLMNSNPEWKEEFVDRLVEIRDGVFKQARARVDTVCKQIRPYVEADPNKTAPIADFDADCEDVKDRISKRIAYLKEFLGR